MSEDRAVHQMRADTELPSVAGMLTSDGKGERDCPSPSHSPYGTGCHVCGGQRAPGVPKREYFMNLVLLGWDGTGEEQKRIQTRTPSPAPLTK